MTLKGSDIYRKKCYQNNSTPMGSHGNGCLFTAINIEPLQGSLKKDHYK